MRVALCLNRLFCFPLQLSAKKRQRSVVFNYVDNKIVLHNQQFTVISITMKGEKRTESILNVSFYRRWGGETELSSALLPKRLVSILLVLVLTALSLSAQNNLKWSWHSPDERISSYRWQLDGEKENRWTVVESSVTSIILVIRYL